MRTYQRENERKEQRLHLQLAHEDGEFDEYDFDMDSGEWHFEGLSSTQQRFSPEDKEDWPEPEVQVAVDAIINGVPGEEATEYLFFDPSTSYQFAWLIKKLSPPIDLWTAMQFDKVYNSHYEDNATCAVCAGVWFVYAEGGPSCKKCGVGPLCWFHTELDSGLCPLCAHEAELNSD